MSKKQVCLFGFGIACLLTIPALVVAEETPIIRCWNRPHGTAAEDSRFRHWVTTYRTDKGEAALAAQDIREQYFARISDPNGNLANIYDNELVVFLKNWGSGSVDRPGPTTILFDPADALPDPNITYHQVTPWMKHALDPNRPDGGVKWMEQFIQAYKDEQANFPGFPDPHRIIFDIEIGAMTPGGLAYNNWELLDGIRSDLRWNSEPIAGFGNSTLRDLWIDAGFDPNGDPDLNCNHYQCGNDSWATFYYSLVWQALDGALNQMALQPLRAAFPACKSSNYGSSIRTDGDGNNYIIASSWGFPQYYRPHWAGFGDLQMPVNYGAYIGQVGPNETCAEAWVRIGRHNVDAVLHSFSGADPNEVTPWLPLYGWQHSSLCNNSGKDDHRRYHAMLRSRKIREPILYGSGAGAQDPNNWDALVDIVDDVWRADIDPNSLNIVNGTVGSGQGAAELEWALRDPLELTAESLGPPSMPTLNSRVRYRVRFDDSLGTPPGNWRVHMEFTIPSASESHPFSVDVDMWRWDENFETGSWYRLGTIAVDSSDTVIDDLDLNQCAADFISPEGKVEVRVNCDAMGSTYQSFELNTDLLMLVGAD